MSTSLYLRLNDSRPIHCFGSENISSLASAKSECLSGNYLLFILLEFIMPVWDLFMLLIGF